MCIRDSTNPRTSTNPQLQIDLADGSIFHQRSTLSNDLILEYQNGTTLNDFTTFSTSETNTSLSEQLETAEIDINLAQERQFFRLRIRTLDSN